ncbi:helix-turn-helix transcriptional regulator, partial [Acidobacteriota bacterium]
RVVEHVMSVTDDEFANLSVAVLACSLKINRFKLSRQFRSQSDMTLEEFLFKEKMARAAFLLKTFQDITVKEVSRRIGFCTCDYFIRKFKQYYGVAPGRYKEFKIMSNGIGEQKSVCKGPGKLVPHSKTPETGDWSKGRMEGCAHCYYKSFVLGMMVKNV